MIPLTVLAAAAIAETTSRLVVLPTGISFPGQGTAVKEYDGVDPGMAFTEVIPSWNVEDPEAATLKVELRASSGSAPTKWFVLGEWSYDPKLAPRVSVNGQRDADGDVLTDTLHLYRPATKLDVRVTMHAVAPGKTARLRLLTLSFHAPAPPEPDLGIRSEAWGKEIDVPQRAQGNYPNGGVLCSATSVSMLLCHWSKVLGRPDIDRDVPDVVSGVWDSVYNGAGNWPFNVAFAGSMPGLRGYVSRFTSIADAEKWIAAGIPIACSCPLDLLMGRTPTGDSGHLVVLVGFTPDGNPIFNDPAHRAQVRRIYARANFEKAWIESQRTVYLIYPESGPVPKDDRGLWVNQP